MCNIHIKPKTPIKQQYVNIDDVSLRHVHENQESQIYSITIIRIYNLVIGNNILYILEFIDYVLDFFYKSIGLRKFFAHLYFTTTVAIVYCKAYINNGN